MRTMGRLTLCLSLRQAGLVDRFRVVVHPVITGRTGQDRIHGGYPDVALEMTNSRTLDGRTQLLEYLPAVLAGPPEPKPLPDADPWPCALALHHPRTSVAGVDSCCAPAARASSGASRSVHR
jgi:hypothetical protein